MFLLGVCLLLVLQDLSLIYFVYFVTAIVAIAWYISSIKFKAILQLMCVGCLGASYGLYQANLHLAKMYPEAEQKQFVTIIGTVADLPQENKDKNQTKVKFKFLIQKIIQPETSKIIPGLVRLTWQTTQLIEIGDQWQLTVRLKKPRGFANPGSFDAEKYYFSQRIIAIGYVVDKFPKKLASFYQQYPHKRLHYDSGHKVRQYFHDHVMQALAGKEFVGVILALITGVQQKISPLQWEVFRDVGVAHLLAGLHIAFIAGLGFIFAGMLCRFMPRRWLKIPVPIVGSFAAIAIALSYAYLAGFSVSTQRSCLMVVLAMLGIISRRVILPVDIFAYALLIVLLMDPFAIFTLAFWLSFTAVAILLYAFAGRKVHGVFDKWIRPNLVMSFGLIPLLLISFNTVPLISPIANSIAVPWVSVLVAPNILFGTILYPLWPSGGAWLWSLANRALELLWPILVKLQQLSWANWQPFVPSLWCLGLAFVGVLWVLAPKGFPGRVFGFCGFLPLLFPTVEHLKSGELSFTLLDVGQGLAVVIETKGHVLVYDTGPKFSDNFDAGEQVIWPFLLVNNIKQIDKLIVSHADLDHSGGVQSLLKHVKPRQILTPKPELLGVALKQMVPCVTGQHWQWDGVNFEMLNPSPPIPFKKNDQSCVLHIKTKTHGILFTGDISASSEKAIIARDKNALRADVVIVPHHGSRSASSLAFVQAVGAKCALASVGYLNQYRHLHPLVIASYREHGAKFIDTAQCGAISFRLKEEGKEFDIGCYRVEHKRIWN